MLKVAFDIGGVLSKYPDRFKELILKLREANSVEVHIITDMHDKEEVRKMLFENGFIFGESYVHCADYETHGEGCKSVLLEELGIDIFFDEILPSLAEENFLLHQMIVRLSHGNQKKILEKFAVS